MTDDVRFGVDCPECGSLDLGPDQLWLVLATATDRSHFAYRCPDCGRVTRRHADTAVIATLGGLVAVQELDVPAEALETHDGEALTADDLIDLMLVLARDGAPLTP